MFDSMLCISDNTLRRKWKYLRDQYSVELAKLLIHPDDSASPATNWIYFNSLSFLRDVITPRTSIMNSQSIQINPRDDEWSPENSEDRNFEFLDSNQIKTELCDDNELAESLNSDDIPQERHHEEDYSVTKPQTTRLTQTTAEQEDEDANMLFFQSILPYVKKIPENKKLSFRTQILNLVDGFLLPNNPE